MSITKEAPIKGLAGLETKKTDLFKDSPKISEMPEEKTLKKLEADIVKAPPKGFEMLEKKNPKPSIGLVVAEKMGEVFGKWISDTTICSDPPIRNVLSDRRKK